MAKTVTEKALIQKILDSNLPMQEKLDILVDAGIPLGAEYHLNLKVTADTKSISWMNDIARFLISSDNVVSFEVDSLSERELGDDEWTEKNWKLPRTPPSPNPSYMFVTTGAQSGSYYNKNPILLHISDDKTLTLCGKVVKPAWKTGDYSKDAKSFEGKKARICNICTASVK